jgi:hypothetical protein
MNKMNNDDRSEKEYQAIGFKEIAAIAFVVAGIVWLLFH